MSQSLSAVRRLAPLGLRAARAGEAPAVDVAPMFRRHGHAAVSAGCKEEDGDSDRDCRPGGLQRRGLGCWYRGVGHPGRAVETDHFRARLPSLFHGVEGDMADLQRAVFGRDSLGFSMGSWREGWAGPLLDEPLLHLASDLVEEQGAFVITADVPGMARGDLRVCVTPEGVLELSGERQRDAGSTVGGHIHCLERGRYGRFSHSFALPPNVDENGIEAVLDKGVLKVTIPKVPEPPKPEPKQIHIQVVGQQRVEAPNAKAAAAPA